mmetsp:Transcript_56958/g.51244  ORF Transcript_56958/g.51244 Transcript_56958/m.51244 type:complete len:294 (-) Transcript_56958:151-1032(-)
MIRVKISSKKIEKQSGIPSTEQLLEIDNKPISSCADLRQNGNTVNLSLLKGDATMQIFFKDLKGQTITLDVGPHYTVDILKQKVGYHTGIPPDDQRLTYGGKELDSDCNKTLSDYNIEDTSTFFLVLKVKGGGYSMDSGHIDAGAVMCCPCLLIYGILWVISQCMIGIGKLFTLCCNCCGQCCLDCGTEFQGCITDCFINRNANYAVPSELTSNWEEYRRMLHNIGWTMSLDSHEIIKSDKHYYPILNAIYRETNNAPSRIRTREQFIEALEMQNVYTTGNKSFVENRCQITI